MMQLFFNAKELKTIKAILFFVNYKPKLNLLNYRESSMLIKIAKNKINVFKKIHENIFKI